MAFYNLTATLDLHKSLAGNTGLAHFNTLLQTLNINENEDFLPKLPGHLLRMINVEIVIIIIIIARGRSAEQEV